MISTTPEIRSSAFENGKQVGRLAESERRIVQVNRMRVMIVSSSTCRVIVIVRGATVISLILCVSSDCFRNDLSARPPVPVTYTLKISKPRGGALVFNS